MARSERVDTWLGNARKCTVRIAMYSRDGKKNVDVPCLTVFNLGSAMNRAVLHVGIVVPRTVIYRSKNASSGTVYTARYC